MKSLMLAGLVLGGLLCCRVPAPACGHDGSCPPPCPPVAVTWVEKKVICYKPEWHVKDVPCTVTRVIPHVVVTPQKCVIMVPTWSEQKRVCTILTRVPRQVEREVAFCRMVRDCVVDPCTGCTHTVCRPVTEVRKVVCTVWDCVPVQKEFTARVCTFHPEEKTVEVRRIVCEYKPETIVRKQSYCVMVPYETTVKVPACVPVCQK